MDYDLSTGVPVEESRINPEPETLTPQGYRELLTGVLLSADDAIAIGKWLIAQGEAHKQALQAAEVKKS